MRVWVLPFLISLCASACTSNQPNNLRWIEDPAPMAVSAPSISWEVVNRYRLLAGEEEEDRFIHDFATYAEARRVWYRRERNLPWFLPNILDADLIGTPRVGPAVPEPYSLTYIENQAHYDRDVLRSRDRQVRASLANAPDDAQCFWTIGDSRTPEVHPCHDHLIEVTLDQPVSVQARQIDRPANAAETEVIVADIVIVALGDSFSAGEGNPHSQWRFVTRHRRPATWMDARCNRSLISGPAIAGAYIARSNPHVSVSLLHYGCSGATTSDGIAGPSSLLVTQSQLQRVYERNTLLFRRIPWFYDVGLMSQLEGNMHHPNIVESQITRARADLHFGGQRHADAIFLSEGGNTIGFADIASAVLVPGETANDLRPARAAGSVEARQSDIRLYGGLDSMRWIEIADYEDEDCSREGLPPVTNQALRAMCARIQERLTGFLAGSQSGASQYDILNSALGAEVRLSNGETQRPLLSEINQTPVFITAYPDPTRRDAHDPDGAFPIRDYEFCVDRGFDGRPGAVPGIIPDLFSNSGLTFERAEFTHAYVVGQLNSTIERAAADQGWEFVDQHIDALSPFGVCSLVFRSTHTVVDSFLAQATPAAGWEPLGRVYLRPELVRTLGLTDVFEGPGAPASPGGLVMDWDIDQSCYRPIRFDGDGNVSMSAECVVLPNEDTNAPPRTRLGLQGRAGVWIDPDNDDESASFGALLAQEFNENRPTRAQPVPTGSVHPTMESQCAYAEALVTRFIGGLHAQQTDRAATLRGVLSDEFLARYPDPTAPINMEPIADGATPFLCTPEAWGLERTNTGRG